MDQWNINTLFTACNIDKNYVGTELMYFKDVQNAINCQKLCQGWSGCQFWTWVSTDPGANICYMKDNITNINDYGDEGQFVLSGPKYCGMKLYEPTFLSFISSYTNFRWC